MEAVTTFIQKYTPGVDLEYSTFLSGRAEDAGLAIDVTGDGVAYVTGYTTAYLVNPVCCIAATDFPIVATMQGFRAYADRIDPVNCPGGGCHFDNMVQAFVTKVNTSGFKFLFSSFLGGDLGSLINVINPVFYFSARFTARRWPSTRRARCGSLEKPIPRTFQSQGTQSSRRSACMARRGSWPRSATTTYQSSSSRESRPASLTARIRARNRG